MHDAQAARAASQRQCQKTTQRQPRFVPDVAVQIELALHHPVAAA